MRYLSLLVIILTFVIYMYFDYFKSIRKDIDNYRSVVLNKAVDEAEEDNTTPDGTGSSMDSTTRDGGDPGTESKNQ